MHNPQTKPTTAIVIDSEKKNIGKHLTIKRSRRKSLSKSTFDGMQVICTSVSTKAIIEIESYLRKYGLNRSEFVKNAVVREVAFFKYCEHVGIDPINFNKNLVNENKKKRQVQKIREALDEIA